MHDIKFIRDNPKIFDKKMNNRNVDDSSENIFCLLYTSDAADES